jgi:carboxyl-terminal processing protease
VPLHGAANQRRYEFGTADDFQLKQAMNHLKGLPVDTAKGKENVAASPAETPSAAH